MAIFFVASGPASAWDPASHVSIVQTALVLSPNADLRLPNDFRNTVFEEIACADLADKICLLHRGPAATKDPAAEAERLLGTLLKPRTGVTPYFQAQTLGRYLHYVADCAVPTPLAEGMGHQIRGFWPNRDFILFREHQALTQPVGESLKVLGRQAQWADDRPDAYPAIFRLAVNLTIEALLLLPPRNGAAAAADDGPPIFVVNRLDSGLSGAKVGYSDSTFYLYSGNMVIENRSSGPYRTSGGGQKQPDLMGRHGLVLAELALRSRRDGTGLRAVLFNNQAVPACGVVFRTKEWSQPLPGRLPPNSLAAVLLEGPAGLSVPEVAASFRTQGCESSPLMSTVIPAERRILVGNFGVPPRFDSGVEVFSATARPDDGSQIPLGSRFSLDQGKAFRVNDGSEDVYVIRVEPAALGKFAGWVSVDSLKMRVDAIGWTFLLLARNQGKPAPGMLSFRFEVTTPDKARRTEEILFDLSELQAGQAQYYRVTVAPWMKDRPSLLTLVSVRRDDTGRQSSGR